MKKFLKQLSGFILLIIGFWAEKSLAQPNFGVSYYGNFPLDPEIQERAWYYFFTRPIFYVVATPFLLGAGVLFYLKKHKKHGKKKISKKVSK